MHFFTEYIQPLTFWLYAHPHWALFITFLISFAESLAIIGSLVPGSITMTAIGILAGSGVLRLDLTYLAATLGAIAGDSGSYALGYTFSDRLHNLWPFKHYPQWLHVGRDYFERHGAISVLVGRFVGPMRSIIPVIAGMMHMPQWRFLVANVLSAIAWSLLYITPGVLIGEASSELSAEAATRLFMLIIILLVIIWLFSLGIKRLLAHTHHFLYNKLHDLWLQLKEHRFWSHFILTITPKNEAQHFKTACLSIGCLLCLIIAITCITLMALNQGFSFINVPIFLFVQSLRTKAFDAFFIIVGLSISPLSLISFTLAGIGYTLYYRDWRSLRYWISLMLSTALVVYFLTRIIHPQLPSSYLKQTIRASFPAINLTFATSLFGFLILFISAHRRSAIILILRSLMFLILLLAGIALIYLGDNWAITVLASYMIGLSICLIHWIFYRREASLHERSQIPLILSFALLTASTCMTYALHYKVLFRSHCNHLAQYIITDDIWWNQQLPVLPIYSTNRIGRRTGLLNIQYLGSIEILHQSLSNHGWKQQPDSFFYSLLMRASGSNAHIKLPLGAKLYQNKKPSLMMTYAPVGQSMCFMLRVWRSNYHLHHYPEPIWLGSIDGFQCASSKVNVSYDVLQAPEYLMKALPGFKFKKIILPKHYLQNLPQKNAATLLMIKDPMTNILAPNDDDGLP
jgi:membrane protein DedA with SNARE-associated domain